MTKLFLIAASAILTAAAGPVAARETATAAASAGRSPTAAPAARPDQRYCVDYTVTGSLVPYKTCQTRAEWLDEGFDPLNPGK